MSIDYDTPPEDKAQLIEYITTAYNEIDALVNSLTPEQIARKDHAGWTIRDHLAHLATWQGGMSAALRKQPRWEAMGINTATMLSLHGNEDALNAKVAESTLNLSWDETRTLFRETHEDFLKVLDGLSFDDIMKPYAHYQPDAPERTDPIAYWVGGNTYGHFMEHLGWVSEWIHE
jgi:hypothetical protein